MADLAVLAPNGRQRARLIRFRRIADAVVQPFHDDAISELEEARQSAQAEAGGAYSRSYDS